MLLELILGSTARSGDTIKIALRYQQTTLLDKETEETILER